MRNQPAILVMIAVELRPTARKFHICEDSFAYVSYSSKVTSIDKDRRVYL